MTPRGVVRVRAYTDITRVAAACRRRRQLQRIRVIAYYGVRDHVVNVAVGCYQGVDRLLAITEARQYVLARQLQEESWLPTD